MSNITLERISILVAVFASSCSSDRPLDGDVGMGARGDVVNVDAPDIRSDVKDVDVPKDQSSDIITDVGPDCVGNGCLATATLIGDFSRDAIASQLDPNVVIENGYSIHWIEFRSGPHVLRGSVAIPYQLSPPARGWHIIVNNPGTVGLADRCGIAHSISGSGLVGYFGARGFVGVTLDYPGINSAGLHPYLDLEVEGRASLDALRAASNLLSRIDAPQSGRFAVTGLSQGGHATLGAAAVHKEYAPELDVRAYAVAGPASVFREHWSPGLTFDGPHLIYHALLTRAWEQAYPSDHKEAVWARGFDPSVVDERCTFQVSGLESLFDVMPNRPLDIFSQTFIDDFANGSTFSFLNDGFNRNRVRAFGSTTPVLFLQGDLDDVVLASSTRELVDELVSSGTSAEYIEVTGATHTTTAFSFLATPQLGTETAILWLNAQLQ